MNNLISKQSVLDKFDRICKVCGNGEKYNGVMCRSCYFEDAIDIVENMKSADQPEIIRCRDCKWWNHDKDTDPYGYCYAIKHGYFTENWEIGIYRKYKGDFFCADAELREDEDEVDEEDGDPRWRVEIG